MLHMQRAEVIDLIIEIIYCMDHYRQIEMRNNHTHTALSLQYKSFSRFSVTDGES